MAMVEPSARLRDALPSINHLDLDKAKGDRVDHSRFSIMAGLNITAPLPSPTNIYSGPPPPYSYASTATAAAPVQTGYISPPEPPRLTAQEGKELGGPRQSLPSISEALGPDKAMAFAPPITTTQPPAASSHQSLLTPSSAVAHSFLEGPSGPSNPFSQPSVTGSAMRDHGYRNDPESSGPSFANLNATEPPAPHSQSFGAARSPKLNPGPSNPHVSTVSGSLTNGHGPAAGSPGSHGPYRSPFGFSRPASGPQSSPFTPASNDPFRTAPAPPFDDQKRYSLKSGYAQSCGESVKRHLDVFDMQMALQEIAELSAQTHNAAREWAQRAHQAPRAGYFPEVLPDMSEVDDALRQSSRVMATLNQIKEAVIAQQTALAEQRARVVKGDYYEDDYNNLHDDYKGSTGFAGGDAKKRRGKAAPPGRCHSCNRAETPEWRRGPDGARTLCNACGLHYAKLTRKMGVNKASSLAGSNLRPKNHAPRSPHQ